MKFIIKKSFIILVFLFFTLFSKSSYSDSLRVEDYGIITLMYHRFEENKYPSTNIRISNFKKQVDLIKNNNFYFVNANKFENDLKFNKEKKKVLLTIDDAFLSFYQNAWPILKKEKIPFILFVSTREVGKFNYMTWNQIREIAKEKFVYIGNHSHTHEYLADMPSSEIIKDIDKSINIFEKEIGKKSDFFSYPFGEYNLDFKKIIIDKGFKYAFGQHSGVSDETKDFFELPRFPINEKYGEIERFKTILNTLPLKYKNIYPSEKYINEKTNPPEVIIEFFNDINNLKNLTCYSNEEDKWRESEIKFIGDFKIKINLKGKFTSERGRINCSLKEANGSWRWLGMQFVVSEK